MATAPSSPAKRFGALIATLETLPLVSFNLEHVNYTYAALAKGNFHKKKKKKQVQNAVCQVTERAVREEGLTLVGI